MEIAKEKSLAQILPATEKCAQEKPNKDGKDHRDSDVTERSVKTVASLYQHQIILDT